MGLTFFTLHGSLKYKGKPQIFHYMYLFKTEDPKNKFILFNSLILSRIEIIVLNLKKMFLSLLFLGDNVVWLLNYSFKAYE